MHRTYSFAVSAPPSVGEFVRYASVAWTAAAINYGLFVLIVVLAPRVAPLLAMVASTLPSMIVSYFGLRFAAFRNRAFLRVRYAIGASSSPPSRTGAKRSPRFTKDNRGIS